MNPTNKEIADLIAEVDKNGSLKEKKKSFRFDVFVLKEIND